MLASRDFASVMTALSEKFGKPTLVETPQIQTRAGATFENTTFVWRIGDGEIKGEKFGGSLDSSWVHYTTDFAKSAIGESTKAKAKAAAKSL